MIWIEHVGEIPPKLFDQLNDDAANELGKMTPECAKNIFARSLQKWILYQEAEPLIVVGVMYHTLLSDNREMWAMPLKGLERHPQAAARTMKRLMTIVRVKFPSVYIRVDPNNKKAVRFATFLGFSPLHHHQGYDIYKGVA